MFIRLNRLVIFSLELTDVFGRKLSETQQVSDLPPSRMGNERELRSVRKCSCQNQRIVDRALTHGAVFKGEDIVLERPSECLPFRRRLARMQGAETALRVGSCSVDEEENGPVRSKCPWRNERRGVFSRWVHPAIEAFFRSNLSLDEPDDQLGRQPRSQLRERGASVLLDPFWPLLGIFCLFPDLVGFQS